jgi:hypothetical protein
MNLHDRLKSLFGEVLREVANNPQFAERISRVLDAAQPAPRLEARKGRRSPGVLDPFLSYQQGEAALQARLDELNVEQLKDIIAEHGMDRSKLAMKWKTKEKLVPFIVTTVASRARKGDAFRSPASAPQTNQPPDAPVRIPIDAIDTDPVRAALRAADVILAVDPQRDFCEELYGQSAIARGRSPGSSPYPVQLVEIEVSSVSTEQVDRARAAVKSAKG